MQSESETPDLVQEILLDFKPDKAKREVQKRLDDWELRLSNLFSILEEWALEIPLCKVKISGSVTLYEREMQEVNIPPREFKMAKVFIHTSEILVFKPIGLWGLNANGIIDILGTGYKMIDTAEPFQSPDWLLYHGLLSPRGKPFTQKEFYSMIQPPEPRHHKQNLTRVHTSR
jgi:hypothetical protein